jgi:hypothetical protein
MPIQFIELSTQVTDQSRVVAVMRISPSLVKLSLNPNFEPPVGHRLPVAIAAYRRTPPRARNIHDLLKIAALVMRSILALGLVVSIGVARWRPIDLVFGVMLGVSVPGSDHGHFSVRTPMWLGFRGSDGNERPCEQSQVN